MTRKVYFPCVRLVKLLKTFRTEDGKYSANEASYNAFLGNFQMRSSAENLHHVFDRGDHPTQGSTLTF